LRHDFGENDSRFLFTPDKEQLSEAIKRAVNVRVVPTSSAWTSGWTVQLPDNSVLRTQNALSTNLTSVSGSTITYQANGRLTALPSQIVFKSAETTIPARCIKVDLIGRATSKVGSCP